MTLEESIKIYNKLANNERIKQFEDARSLILEEMNSRKPELEFYKPSEKYHYYIEKPYEELVFKNDKVIKRQHGYSAIGKNRVSTVNFCLSLCNYSKEEIIKIIEEHIKEDNKIYIEELLEEEINE